jgi:hypothetical protein
MIRGLVSNLLLTAVVFAANSALAEPVEIYCTIRNNGANMNCQTLGKEKKVMSADDITKFIDSGEVAAYITLKSRKGIDRTYMVDSKAPQYKRLADMKRSGSMSDIGKAKSDLFAELEKKVIKVSDEQDAQAAAAELILYDPGITYDKNKREAFVANQELDSYRKNRDKVCTSTPAFEQISKANTRLQQTLSSVVFAFQTPGTCMANFKIFKDRDGSIDLRQLDTLGDSYKEQCKVK